MCVKIRALERVGEVLYSVVSQLSCAVSVLVPQVSKVCVYAHSAPKVAMRAGMHHTQRGIGAAGNERERDK